MRRIIIEVKEDIFKEVLLAIQTWIDDFYSGPDREMISVKEE